MFKKLREPVNSLTHWAGAILALIGLIALLLVGWGTPAKVISLAIYGASLIFLFSASATYHMVNRKDKVLEIFRKVDHAAIYVLIAGTYTPFCVNAFKGFWKWGMLSILWSLALIGIIVKDFLCPLTALAECRDLCGDGLAGYRGRRANFQCLAGMGGHLADRRRRDLHPGRSGVQHQNLQFHAWRVWVPRDLAHLRYGCCRSTFCRCDGVAL